MNEFVRFNVADVAPWTPSEFEAQIRAVGPECYHDLHPFHKMLHGGKLNKGQVTAWALNRYVYQEAIPRKDAAFMSRVHDRELRREWIHRVHDHDGLPPEELGRIVDCDLDDPSFWAAGLALVAEQVDAAEEAAAATGRLDA